jgi:hypothetical protein
MKPGRRTIPTSMSNTDYVARARATMRDRHRGPHTHSAAPRLPLTTPWICFREQPPVHVYRLSKLNNEESGIVGANARQKRRGCAYLLAGSETPLRETSSYALRGHCKPHLLIRNRRQHNGALFPCAIVFPDQTLSAPTIIDSGASSSVRPHR